MRSRKQVRTRRYFEFDNPSVPFYEKVVSLIVTPERPPHSIQGIECEVCGEPVQGSKKFKEKMLSNKLKGKGLLLCKDCIQ